MIGILKLSIIYSFWRRGFSTLVPSCASTASDTPWAMLCVRIDRFVSTTKVFVGYKTVCT